MINCRFVVWARRLLPVACPVFLVGCTTLLATTSIEPYTKHKEARNALEQLAENYCARKRGMGEGDPSAKRPDFLFATDGCSRWPDDGWVACCILHDIAYWCGGSVEDRREADQSLRQCVNGEWSGMGYVVYPGVRVGGSPWLPTPWRWGYGWDAWPMGYEALEHSKSVNSILEELNAESLVADQLKSASRPR